MLKNCGQGLCISHRSICTFGFPSDRPVSSFFGLEKHCFCLHHHIWSTATTSCCCHCDFEGISLTSPPLNPIKILHELQWFYSRRDLGTQGFLKHFEGNNWEFPTTTTKIISKQNQYWLLSHHVRPDSRSSHTKSDPGGLFSDQNRNQTCTPVIKYD